MKEVDNIVNEINQINVEPESGIKYAYTVSLPGAALSYISSLGTDTEKAQEYQETQDSKLLRGIDEYDGEEAMIETAFVSDKLKGTTFYNANGNPLYGLKVNDEELVAEYQDKIRKAADNIENSIDKSYGNDETDMKMKAFIKTTTSDLIKKTIDGFSPESLCYRTPIAMGLNTISACVSNNTTNGKLKDNMKKWQYKFPVYDFVIEGNELEKTLISYYKEKDQNGGVLAPEKEDDYRQKIYDNLVSTMTYYNRVMAASENIKLNAEIKADLVTDALNDAIHLHPLSARGTVAFNAALETYKAGLENGWPMEDLASVSAFATIAHTLKAKAICNRATDAATFKMYDTPQYESKEHQAYVESMNQLFEDFKAKPLTSAEERTKFLDDMHKKIQEGVEKKYIKSAANKNENEKEKKNESKTVDYYYNQSVANRIKYEKFIQQKKAPAVHKKVEVGPERRIVRIYADLTAKRTDLRFSSENKEHKNLRLAVEDLRKFYRENPAPGPNATKADIAKYNMRYLTKLEQVSHYSDIYKKTHKDPSSKGGKARLKGAVEFGDFAASEKFEIEKQLKANKLTVPDNEKNRKDMRKSLEKMLKGLNARHRGTLHREALDSKEMTLLKDKTTEAIEYLKVNRGVNLFEDEKFGQIMNELSECSNNYTKAKKDVARENFRKELVDESLPKGSEERLAQEREVIKKMKAWKPKTQMGQSRFNAAQDVSSFCKEFKNNQKEYNYALEGHPSLDAKQIAEEADKPYEAGVDEILNYYKKYPSCIREHFKKNLVNDKSFKAACAPIECDGISEEDFALVAYAAILNTDTIPDASLDKKSQNKSPEVTKKDRIRQNRTMYSLDIGGGKSARENCINHFGEDFIKPARLKAKEVLEQYKAGNKEPLINILAEGISESSYECMHSSHMFGGRRNAYCLGVGLLDRLIDYSKREPGLYDAVMAKLTPEAKQNIDDTLNLKEYLDKCIASEKKLDDAVKNNITLSEAEKKQCLKDIVTYDFLSVNHDKFRDEQVENDMACKEFKAKYDNLTMDIITGKITDMTADDLIKIDTKLEQAARKPIAQVHGRLRTEEGRKKLDEAVQPLVDAIPANVPEKDLQSAAMNFGENLKTEMGRAKVEAAAAKREQFIQMQNNKKIEEPKAMGPA
ncbi:hypothetical protein SAMN06297422_10140 [Lachnospiraceae bacterium]|nr:hypothetical protein SAMN06297422_10140 [Lachnospiraceae bacterium]